MCLQLILNYVSLISGFFSTKPIHWVYVRHLTLLYCIGNKSLRNKHNRWQQTPLWTDMPVLSVLYRGLLLLWMSMKQRQVNFFQRAYNLKPISLFLVCNYFLVRKYYLFMCTCMYACIGACDWGWRQSLELELHGAWVLFKYNTCP